MTPIIGIVTGQEATIIPELRHNQHIVRLNELATLPPGMVDGLLSLDVMGGLDPRYMVGTVVIAAGVHMLNGKLIGASLPWTKNIREVLRQSNVTMSVDFTTVFSSNADNTPDPASKAELFKRTGCGAADMIAYSVAEWATVNKKPWAAIGTLSDAWNQSTVFPPDSIDPSGNINIGASLKWILQNPGKIGIIAQEAWTTMYAIHVMSVITRILVASNWGFNV